VVTLTLDELTVDPHPHLHLLRDRQPVAWVEVLDGWLVTGHELCLEVMLDADTFTVDDPRFSTQQVIGPSMLSLDGLEHKRHRDPFAGPFRAGRVRRLREEVKATAGQLIANVAGAGGGDLRAEIAAPLAVTVMASLLDLSGVADSDVLAWYDEIVDAVHIVTAGGAVPESAHDAFGELHAAVAANLSSSDLLSVVDQSGTLDVEEIVSNVAVLLFGGIVTSESSTAIAFRYLLDDPDLHRLLRKDRTLVSAFVEETLRLEPSASAVDRYATRDTRLGEAEIRRGDLVKVSLSGANRDPAVFPDPDRLDLGRTNHGRSVTFARGPHACLGIHLARLETTAAVEALLESSPHPEAAGLDPVTGLVFRVPETVNVAWP
jgi:cytochrome P450